jgi:two-component system, OmpR family, phosphate regulon sensor histidine kinase PhoR
MHPLRVLLYISIVIAVAVSWGFGAALVHAGVARTAAIVLALAAFVAFMIPWSGVYLWAMRHAGDLDALTDRSRLVADGQVERGITDRAYHGEVDDLARAIEEIRMMVVRQLRSHAEHRAAMDEIVSSLGEGIIAVSPRGRVVVANAHVANMFRLSGSLVGRPFLEVVRKQSIVAALDRALDGAESTDRVTIDERQYEVRVFPVAASPEIAAVVLFIDVTTLERLQRIRKDFLDDFSHEVRTPLAGLRSAVETLDAGGLTKEQGEQLRQVILRQLSRIERLVRDLSDLNNIESGQIALQRQPVDLRGVLRELSDDHRFTLAGGEATASADPARAQQIFSNLLDNARKHGGGDIVVEIGTAGGEAVVKVSDRGAGIPSDEVERIFNRFYRVDKSRSQHVPGAGLGLAIAKHLVALHGGSIRAYNRAEGGATFEVRLPVA